MEIFITGASGFVGGAATRRFVERGYTVRAMSRSEQSDAKIRALGAIPVRCALGAVPTEALAGCAMVLHAAAYVEEWGPYEAYYQANVEGTRQLLEAAQKAGVQRFIFISTEAVLFAGSDLNEVDERTPYPETPFFYPKTKQAAEKLVLAANIPARFETICLRPRLIWGPGDQTVLPILLERIEQGQFSWVSGGRFRTSTTHIDNLVHGIELAWERGRGGEIYFLTDGEPMLNREFMTQLIESQGVKAPTRSTPKWLVRSLAALVEGWWRLTRRKTTPPLTRFLAAILSSHCTVRDDKARRELGYAPVISVAQGIQALRQV